MYRYAHLKIKPSRINGAYVGGPRVHFDRITEEQLRALGGGAMPGLLRGSCKTAAGITARRLKDGRLNVVIESTAEVLRDPAFDRLMDALVKPIEQPGPPAATPTSGTWSWDIATDAVTLCRGALAMLGMSPTPNLRMADLVAQLNDIDGAAVTQALGAALHDNATYDICFSWVGQAPRLRSTAVVLRDRDGKPHRMSGAIIAAPAQVRARGEIA